ncbi:hypothetical protein KY290_013677 [Solanum tuberosum]|uniref:DUF4283 domain-containing protein n=1 Tax=Solanum tuberosum TaxID=4113 RepID=A0ABQ7VNN5_SOLTU|nr:hypothetical protein KY290_013677 [Solanum tuberosum]
MAAQGMKLNYVAPTIRNGEKIVELCKDENDTLYSKTQGPHMLGNMPIIVKTWSLDFDLKKEIMQSIPVWSPTRNGYLPADIKVEDPNGREFTQNVVYEWVPVYCPKCMIIGHKCQEKGEEHKQKDKIVKRSTKWQQKRAELLAESSKTIENRGLAEVISPRQEINQEEEDIVNFQVNRNKDREQLQVQDNGEKWEEARGKSKIKGEDKA